MFRLSKAILSTVLAWIFATGFISLWGIFSGPAPITPPPIGEIASLLLFYGFYVGAVVFSTCLLVVVPFLRLVPKNSRLWQPLFACIAAAIASPVAIYLWAAAFQRHWFVPKFDDPAYYGFGLTAIVAGVTFALSYSRSLIRSNPPLPL